MKPYYDQDGITIFHGDCREVLPGLDRVDLVLTDPPYSNKTHRSIRSNNKNAPGGMRVVNFAATDTDALRPIFERLGAITRRWVVSTLDYSAAFEFDVDPPVGLRVMRIGVWVKTNPMPSLVGDRPGQGWEAVTYMHRVDIKPQWSGGVRSGNFILPTEQGTGHPTAKPLSMARQIVEWFSDPGDTILDPFMGSGTTLRAAKDVGRRAIGIELEERYCEIAAKRLAQGVLFGGGAA